MNKIRGITVGILIIAALLVVGCSTASVPTPTETPQPTPIPTALPMPTPTLSPTPEPTPIPTLRPTPRPTAEPTPRPTSAPLLEVVEHHYSREYGYLIAEGLVKNISSHSMDSVLAEVKYYTADGTFVTSDWTFIDYQPIMAGQSSPFKIYTTDNPAISKTGLSFRYFAGGTIKTK